MTPQLVHFRDIRRATGIDSARSLKAVCSRYGISVVRLNKRVLALTSEDFQSLLMRLTNQAEAA